MSPSSRFALENQCKIEGQKGGQKNQSMSNVKQSL